jgi:hypothetical protein
LKEASLAIGAQGMADICEQLENFEATQNVGGTPAELARLDLEFDRVQSQIEQEGLIP